MKTRALVGLGLMAVALAGCGGRQPLKPFFEKHKLPHLKGWADPETNFGFHYATGLLPTTVIYDAQGKEMVRVIGAMDWEGPEAKALIDAAMQS